VPVVNYMRACPLPKADEALKKLEEVDPESVRRANTFFTIPVPAKDPGASSSRVNRDSPFRFAASADLPAATGKTGQPTADLSPLPRVASAVSSEPTNPWRLAYVLGLALATVMIAQFLLLSGGSQPTASQPTAQ
jgi:hypothetical protein